MWLWCACETVVHDHDIDISFGFGTPCLITCCTISPSGAIIVRPCVICVSECLKYLFWEWVIHLSTHFQNHLRTLEIFSVLNKEWLRSPASRSEHIYVNTGEPDQVVLSFSTTSRHTQRPSWKDRCWQLEVILLAQNFRLPGNLENVVRTLKVLNVPNELKDNDGIVRVLQSSILGFGHWAIVNFEYGLGIPKPSKVPDEKLINFSPPAPQIAIGDLFEVWSC